MKKSSIDPYKLWKTVYEHIDELQDAGAVEARETKQRPRYTLAETDVGEKVWELEGVTLQHLADE